MERKKKMVKKKTKRSMCGKTKAVKEKSVRMGKKGKWTDQEKIRRKGESFESKENQGRN